jgi:uncharacterized protein
LATEKINEHRLRVPPGAILVHGSGDCMIDEELLAILACPACKEPIRLEQQEIVCTGCGRRYPVRDGIPIMLLEEATAPTQPEDEESRG